MNGSISASGGSSNVAMHRFEIPLLALETQLRQAKDAVDPALTFYHSNARQQLFYLEALARIYRHLHNKKRFKKMRTSFKSLEDQLGCVDYYDGFIKEFSLQKDFPAELLTWLRLQYRKELDALNQMLQAQWFAHDYSALKKITQKLDSAAWLSPGKDRQAVGAMMMDEIDSILKDYKRGKLNFKTIEEGVHEFRRQLRWISIYAQALNGLIQLREVKVPSAKLELYLSKEVIENPFNKLPPAPPSINPIYIEAPSFYALSWIIGEGGNLKDEALRIIILEDAISATQFTAAERVTAKARELAINSRRSISQVKHSMKVIAGIFMNKHKVLQRIRRDIKQAIS